MQSETRPDPKGDFRRLNPLFYNRRGSIISYNFIRKEKISNALITANGEPLFQKFLDPALQSPFALVVARSALD